MVMCLKVAQLVDTHCLTLPPETLAWRGGSSNIFDSESYACS